MQELLGRLKELDPEASLMLRVIACFDELIVGNVGSRALLSAAASLAGCPVGFRRDDTGTVTRVGVDGEVLGGLTTIPTSGPGVDSGAGLTVWIEREGAPHANDAIILERVALALRVRHGHVPTAESRRSLGVAVDRDSDEDSRREAMARLNLRWGDRHRVIATPLFATWSGHPAAREDVVATPKGPMHVLVVGADVVEIPASPAGIGIAVPGAELPRSLQTALLALALAEPPAIPRVLADDYGVLLELVAEAGESHGVADLEPVGRVMAHRWGQESVDALVRSGSLREAARVAGVHHSTMSARLDVIREELGFDPVDGMGRVRLGIAYVVWRLRNSRVLDLPVPH